MPLTTALGCIGAAASPANASDRRSRMHISVKIPHQCLRPHLSCKPPLKRSLNPPSHTDNKIPKTPKQKKAAQRSAAFRVC
jgi:hypothetical protein